MAPPRNVMAIGQHEFRAGSGEAGNIHDGDVVKDSRRRPLGPRSFRKKDRNVLKASVLRRKPKGPRPFRGMSSPRVSNST